MTSALLTLGYLLACVALVATVALWVALLISGCWGLALVVGLSHGGSS